MNNLESELSELEKEGEIVPSDTDLSCIEGHLITIKEFMKKVFDCFFPEYSKWIDVGIKDINGYYTLIQYHYRIKDNKKSFRTSRIGFINFSVDKDGILNKIQNNEQKN
jgi:hypothetical protein